MTILRAYVSAATFRAAFLFFSKTIHDKPIDLVTDFSLVLCFDFRIDIFRNDYGTVTEKMLSILYIHFGSMQHACIAVPELMRGRSDAVILLVFLQASFQSTFPGQSLREENKRLFVFILGRISRTLS